MVIDELARSELIQLSKVEKNAQVGRGVVSGRRVLLAKPMVFMNKSGESVAGLSKFYQIPPSRILVVSDDLEQSPGGLKLAPSGGHGGHNGLRSITQRLGNDDGFARLKVGIGRPPGQTPVASYVLQDFAKKEMETVMQFALYDAVDIMRRALAEGVEAAASGINRR